MHAGTILVFNEVHIQWNYELHCGKMLKFSFILLNPSLVYINNSMLTTSVCFLKSLV